MRIHFRESPVDKIRPNRIVPTRLQITEYRYTGEGLSKPALWPVLPFTALSPISGATSGKM